MTEDYMSDHLENVLWLEVESLEDAEVERLRRSIANWFKAFKELP